MKALITISTDDGKSFRQVGMLDPKTGEIVRFVKTVKSKLGAERVAKNRANGRPYLLCLES